MADDIIKVLSNSRVSILYLKAMYISSFLLSILFFKVSIMLVSTYRRDLSL